jgi:hypothetical protein
MLLTCELAPSFTSGPMVISQSERFTIFLRNRDSGIVAAGRALSLAA